MSPKDTYRQLCQERTDIPLFMQAWWLDATDMPWEVILFEHKKQIAGFYVYSYTQKWGKKLILQPSLTQYSGPLLFYPDGLSLAQKYSFENKAYNYFIEQLAATGYHFIEQNWHHSQQNHQPFYWQGFRQTTRYTYILPQISNLQDITKALSDDKKKKLNRAQGDELQLSTQLAAADFYSFYKDCLQNKQKKIYYPLVTFEQLHTAAMQHNSGQILALYDTKQQLHAALWVVWDSTTAYNLIIAINENHKSSGASTRIIFEAMRFLQGKTQQYDFEGSMIQGVALHNQSFSAQQIPYHHIQKSHSKLLSLWRYLKK